MRVKVDIDQALFTQYKDIRLGCIQFDATVQESQPKFWEYVDNDVIPGIRQSLEGKEWNQIPGVKGSRLAYKAFGRNPGRYRVSSEALLRRVRRLDPLYHINTVVDVNNLISIQSGLSVGSYDLAFEGWISKEINGFFLDEEDQILYTTYVADSVLILQPHKKGKK